jgi:hypothetical protein
LHANVIDVGPMAHETRKNTAEKLPGNCEMDEKKEEKKQKVLFSICFYRLVKYA